MVCDHGVVESTHHEFGRHCGGLCEGVLGERILALEWQNLVVVGEVESGVGGKRREMWKGRGEQVVEIRGSVGEGALQSAQKGRGLFNSSQGRIHCIHLHDAKRLAISLTWLWDSRYLAQTFRYGDGACPPMHADSARRRPRCHKQASPRKRSLGDMLFQGSDAKSWELPPSLLWTR